MGKGQTVGGEEVDFISAFLKGVVNMPLISVIMGVYNSGREPLLRAVSSVLSQTLSDFELIICDDGSDVQTKAVLSELPQDDRIRIIENKDNAGLAAALNACIDIARGEFIARQDDDDYSAPDRFEKQIDFFNANPGIDYIGTNCRLFDKSGKIYSQRTMPENVDEHSFLFNSPFIHGSMMFRKRVFEKHRYRIIGKERKNEDYDLFMRLCADGYKAANMQKYLYFFYFDPEIRKIPFSLRCDEYRVRKEGFKRLGLMPKSYIYAIKPLVLGLIPTALLIKIKKKTKGL